MEVLHGNSMRGIIIRFEVPGEDLSYATHHAGHLFGDLR